MEKIYFSLVWKSEEVMDKENGDGEGDKGDETEDRRSAIADCRARRVWNAKRASLLWGVGAFRSKFYENGVIPWSTVYSR